MNHDGEIERRGTDGELREQELRFRLFYDQTPTMFFTVDGDGTVCDVNRFAVEQLGYPVGDLLGENVLKIVYPDDRAEVRQHLCACFTEPGAVRTFYFRKLCSDGRIIWVKETTRVVRGPDGARAFIVCEDVTESRAHEEAARKAESIVHHKDEFMAMLGHELRNPLAPIVTALELLRRRGRNDPELQVIERQISHMRRLVDDLLDVSRITRGKVELHTQRVELAVVAAQAVEMARPLFREKRQELYVAVAPSGLLVDADPARLVQAFSNLLNNAAKYSGEGKAVYFSAAQRDGRILVQVRDEGEGIAPEMLERIFHLFVQREQPADRAQSGLGLGLTIVRNLVELHGGTVHARSGGRGAGATLVVNLPAATGEIAPREVHFPDNAAEQSARATATGDLLIVDDNEDAREMLRVGLSALGFQVTGASDGPSALLIAEDIRPRLAVIDIGLPGMDGYELARRLRLLLGDALRLVALTGYGQEADRMRSQEYGFEAHLVKPIDLVTSSACSNIEDPPQAV